jgi:hypothetical protein
MGPVSARWRYATATVPTSSIGKRVSSTWVAERARHLGTTASFCSASTSSKPRSWRQILSKAEVTGDEIPAHLLAICERPPSEDMPTEVADFIATFKTEIPIHRSMMMTDKPPRRLGEHGTALWGAIQAEYKVTDAGGIEMLAQACSAADRAEQLAAEIARSGVLFGVRANPLIKDELACRAFIVRTLHRLGLDVEPVRPVGRPPGPQWKGHHPNAD